MRRLMILAPLALAAAMALSGCGGKEPPPDQHVTDDAPGDFSRPMYARGTNPTWSLRISGSQLTLSRPGQPDLAVQAPGAVIQPNQASWTAVLPDHTTLKVVLYASSCADPVSGDADPFSAEVDLPGDGGLLGGCAYRIAASRPHIGSR